MSDRETPADTDNAFPVAAIILAAGQSSRMGDVNKLLVNIDGRPMADLAVDAALLSKAEPVIVVTGHQFEAVTEALSAHSDAIIVHNRNYADGLSTSLIRGINAVSPDAPGVIVCLADMPGIAARHLDQLIDAFNAHNANAIIQPTFEGRRGNPVIWPRVYFDEILELTGDTGARGLIATHEANVVSVAMEDDAILIDVDTPGDAEIHSPPTGTPLPHADIPYQERILELSDMEAGRGQLDAPDASALADNPYCGDRVTVDVKMDGNVIGEIAQQVQGCILCEASANVAATHAAGNSAADIEALTETLTNMLKKGGDGPTGAWADMAVFAAVADHKSRHDCVLVPFHALNKALGAP